MAGKKVTEAQALAAYRRACKVLGVKPSEEIVEQGTGGYGWVYDRPVLCRDFDDEPGRFALVWEGGYAPNGDEWVDAVAVAENAREKSPVFAEPYTSWALCFYPNTMTL